MKQGTVKMEELPLARRQKAKTIAIMNNKGGCGKTTTCIAIGLHLARAGYNVLFWDNDPQANLTQRLGYTDTEFPEHRLSHFFRNYGKLNTKGILITKYPYFYRLAGQMTKPGKLGVMCGDRDSISDAEGLMKRTTGVFSKNIYTAFSSELQFYKQYFDFIVMDTAPSIQGNLLCELAVKSADEIVCPVDGLESATGINNLLGWVEQQTRPYGWQENMPRNYPPNITLAMIKYQSDTKNFEGLDEILGTDGDPKTMNIIYRLLKKHFNEYVCDYGIKELQALRHRVYGGGNSAEKGFGKSTAYDDLCNEILHKINSPRKNFYETYTEDMAAAFTQDLEELGKKVTPKRAKTLFPVFMNDTG